jgi:hypothetical protein
MSAIRGKLVNKSHSRVEAEKREQSSSYMDIVAAVAHGHWFVSRSIETKQGTQRTRPLWPIRTTLTVISKNMDSELLIAYTHLGPQVMQHVEAVV